MAPSLLLSQADIDLIFWFSTFIVANGCILVKNMGQLPVLGP